MIVLYCIVLSLLFKLSLMVDAVACVHNVLCKRYWDREGYY